MPLMSEKTKTTYEWVAEKLDEHGDIEDCFYVDTREDAKSIGGEIALCRRVHYVEDGDEAERQYAYLENEELPDEFDGGAKVPKRFR